MELDSELVNRDIQLGWLAPGRDPLLFFLLPFLFPKPELRKLRISRLSGLSELATA